MSLDPLPRAITHEPVLNMLITEELVALYEYASKREEDETATVPLFEKFLNVWMDCRNLSVWSQQRLDGTQRKIDLALGFSDVNHKHPLVFVLIAECKRNEIQDLGDLRAQAENYANRYLDVEADGRAREEEVFTATAFGTKIRFFRETRFESESFTGGLEIGKEHYWDLKDDGILIRDALVRIWNYRAGLLPFHC